MNQTWHLENFDFYKVLCPYKYDEHVQKHPNQCFKKHDFLFLEKDPAREIYLIDRGKVKLGQYDAEGNEFVIAILGRGEILGQTALLGEVRHRSFAEVAEDGTQVCKMSVEKARELTRDYVPFAIELNRRIGEHIRRLERRIEILLFKDVRQRLVEFLKDMAEL
ncbi:MAG: Crp/Fnr family transcriptional regulator, partial [Bacteroidota bacterium]